MFFTQEDLRKIEEYLKQNSKKDTDFKQLLQNEILADDDIVTIVHKGTNYKVSVATLAKVLESERVSTLMDFIKDLQNQIDSINSHGMTVSNYFGDNPHIGISQKTLTEAFSRVWAKFEDMTGEVTRGISMAVTPTFFVSENGCTIHVSANTVATNGIFEKIQFFVDGVMIHEETNTEYVSFNHHLDIKPEYDYVIMCKAKIMGIEYTRQQIVTRYNEFYIGAGATYADVMNREHVKQINKFMRASYDVSFIDGQKLVIVLGAPLRSAFIRADLNGAEIQFTEQSVTVDGRQYMVFTSEPWGAGDYNIDING